MELVHKKQKCSKFGVGVPLKTTGKQYLKTNYIGTLKCVQIK